MTQWTCLFLVRWGGSLSKSAWLASKSLSLLTCRRFHRHFYTPTRKPSSPTAWLQSDGCVAGGSKKAGTRGHWAPINVSSNWDFSLPPLIFIIKRAMTAVPAAQQTTTDQQHQDDYSDAAQPCVVFSLYEALWQKTWLKGLSAPPSSHIHVCSLRSDDSSPLSVTNNYKNSGLPAKTGTGRIKAPESALFSGRTILTSIIHQFLISLCCQESAGKCSETAFRSKRRQRRLENSIREESGAGGMEGGVKRVSVFSCCWLNGWMLPSNHS